MMRLSAGWWREVVSWLRVVADRSKERASERVGKGKRNKTEIKRPTDNNPGPCTDASRLCCSIVDEMRESYRHISIQLKQINCIQLAPHAAAANPCPTAVVVVDSLILQFALVLVNCTCCCKYTIMRTTTKSQIYSFRRNSCPLLKCFQEFTLTHLTRQGDRPLTKQRTAKSRQLLKSFHTF